MTPGLAVLLTAAPTDCVTVWSVDDAYLAADLSVERPWETRLFQLEIREKGGALSVRERAPTLPSYCPERHIVREGYFCLGLDTTSPQEATAARTWWLSLLRYLELQMHADAAGTWPEHHGWRHGSAWRSQYSLETFLQQADPQLIEDLRAGRMPEQSPRGRRQRQQYRILIDTLSRGRDQMLFEEILFWADVKTSGQACCGTMKNCPLAADKPE